MSQVKGVLVWKGGIGGKKGRTRETRFPMNNGGNPALDTFSQAFKSHSNCKLFSETWLVKTKVDWDTPPATSNCDRKCTVYMRTSLGKVINFSYPDPVSADVESTPQGERLTSTALSAIVALYNTMTGYTCTGLYGVVEQSR